MDNLTWSRLSEESFTRGIVSPKAARRQVSVIQFSLLHFAEKLPTPVKVREGEAEEGAKLSEFQEELLQLAAVLKGDHTLTSYPEKLGKDMTVKEAKKYMEDAVKSFFDAGAYARKMGVNGDQIVKMRPSLTSRPSKP